MERVHARMQELRRVWGQVLSQDSGPRTVAITALVRAPRPVRPVGPDVDPGMATLPGTSTERVYKPSKSPAPCIRKKATCRKCATIDENFHRLSAYDDFAQFKASLDNGTEKPIRLTGRGHCKGNRSRCSRFKRKVVYATSAAGNVSKLNWKLENLLPRVHAGECKRDAACECDNTDTET
jgi:hypothetical protein